MPRVHTRTKSTRATKYPFVCTSCRKEIQPGEQFYTWAQFRSPSRYRHVACGYPRASELSNAKTAVILDAVQDAENEISEMTAELDSDGDYVGSLVEDLQSILQQVGDQAAEVGQEYADGVSSMPDALQYAPTGEAMQDVADRLESWADDLNSWSPSEDAPDLADAEADDKQDILDRWIEDTKQEALDAMQDVPEYEG